MLVDEDVAKDKGWKVGDRVPTIFGKTGKTELASAAPTTRTRSPATT